MPEKIAHKLKNYLITLKEEKQSYAEMIKEIELTDIEKRWEVKKRKEKTEVYNLLKEIYDNTIILTE